VSDAFVLFLVRWAAKPASGLVLDRNWGHKRYPQTVKGQELVGESRQAHLDCVKVSQLLSPYHLDWAVVMFPDYIYGRKHAVAYCQALLDRDLMVMSLIVQFKK